MSIKIIEYIAGDGKTTIKIEVSEYVGRAVATTYIEGKRDFCGSLSSPPKGAPAEAVGAIGRLCLRQDRYEEVRAAMAALQAEIDARPEVQLHKLIAQREELAREVGYIRSAWHEEDQARIERASANGFLGRSARDFAAEEKAARAALAEFDATHPHVAAKIAADKAEAAARFLATD